MYALAAPTPGLPKMEARTARLFIQVAFLLVCATIFISGAIAGTTGEEFKETYDLLMGWATGYLGKIFAIAAFLVGCGWAAGKQNPMPAIFGLVLAIIIGFGPGLVEKLLTAVV